MKDTINAIMTPALVAELMRNLGYSEANERKNFRIRDESTASCSISNKCKIKDFGGDFSGDILDFVIREKQCSFGEATEWVAGRVGVTANISDDKIKEIRFKKKEQEQDNYEKKISTFKYIQQQNFIGRDNNSEKVRNGLRALFPSIKIEEMNRVWHLVGYSTYVDNYVEDDRLTVEIAMASAIRRAYYKDVLVKWKTAGFKQYIHAKINEQDDFVYITSGMAEILALEIMGVSYFGVQSDSVSIEELETTKIVIVIEENDESSRKFSQKCIKHFKNVRIVKPYLMARSNQKGFDLRDYINHIGSFRTAFLMIDAVANATQNEVRPVVGEIVIGYDGDYIPALDIDSGVIVARTGAGKTFQFQSKSNFLIITPRVLQTNIISGEDYDFLLNHIYHTGAVITYNKFYGHYKNTDGFKELIQTKQIKLIVDEAHILLANPSKMHRTIYELDAIFLSGTLEKIFRPDLQRYKFKPKNKEIIYYTDGRIPKLNNCIYFAENAIGMKKKYPNNSITSTQHGENICDIHTTTENIVYATSALREGISVKNPNLRATVVIANKTTLWSVKDTIQALHRVRHKDALKVVTKAPPPPYKGKMNLDWWKDFIAKQKDDRILNALMGEFYRYYTKWTHKPNQYKSASDYGLHSFLAFKARNNFDQDFYEFRELKDVEQMEVNFDTKGEKEKEEGIYSVRTDDGIEWLCADTERQVQQINRWVQQYNSGFVARGMKLAGKIYPLTELYARSNIAKTVKNAYNEDYINKIKGKKYSISMFFALVKDVFEIKIYNQEKKEISTMGKGALNLNNISIQIVGECGVATSSKSYSHTICE